MSVEEAAIRLKAWAKENGVLGYEAVEDLPEEPESISDISAVSDAASVEALLRVKKIALIGVNDENDSIVVYTGSRLTKADREVFSRQTGSDHKIEFRYSPLPKIRSVAAAANAGLPYHTTGDRITCGSSISVGSSIDAGTLGALVQDQSGQLYGLSNNHVCAACNYAEQALPIVAPGLADVRARGLDPFTIGHHHRALGLALGNPDNVNADDNLDAAIFRIADPDRVSSMQRSFYDSPSAHGVPKVGTRVEKIGRTTGLTSGLVTARTVGYEPVEVSVRSFGYSGLAYFSNFFCVQGSMNRTFAAPGDSGSLVTFVGEDGERRAAGLVFAVNPSRSLTFVVPLFRILPAFGVNLVSGHNP